MLGNCEFIQYIEFKGEKYHKGDLIHIINDVSEGSSSTHLLHYSGIIQDFQGDRVVIKTINGGTVKLRIDYINFIENIYKKIKING